MYHTPQKNEHRQFEKVLDCPSYTAYFRLMPDSKVRVFFIKRKLPAEVIQQYFGKGQFEMPFNFDLPSIVLHKLGIESYQINSGFYTVQEDHHYIKVDF